MSLDTPRPETRLERLPTHEALQRLEHERNSRLTQLRALDEVGADAEEHVIAVQKDTIRRVLAEVEAAFARVRDGNYGNCLDCAKPVPVERLEILPYTRFCVPCRRETV
ncbi:TraR/DksA family transcriptional regulator [Streptomyces sp. NPDC020707]|jgi:DnaK suppressor protein|uniref:TraR/DksA C4-type zinc finger protein n=1 Tax=Streptomyces ortus TaxID=2867268 RepID=A0ABT3VF30_9ACTN|nr:MULTISPECIES: TraR/DksA C4-type zinc finger protein [Streptomyces]MCX4238539.1 TraR/DksA C4-type zinc finger protein [Streptomyces ortus]